MSSDDDALILKAPKSLKGSQKLKQEALSSDSDAELIVSPKKQIKRAPVRTKKTPVHLESPKPRDTHKVAVKRRKTPIKEEDEEEEDILVPGDARKYFKEGQKHITPPNGDGTRGFYESLYDENPNSLIAIKYCVENGVLTGTKHHEALARLKILKEMGAYKGMPGGLKKEFEKDQPEDVLLRYRAVMAKSEKAV